MQPFERIRQWTSSNNAGLGAPGKGDWPPSKHAYEWERKRRWYSYWSHDKDAIRVFAQDEGMGGAPGRPYMLSPLPQMITRGKAGLLVGKAPIITTAEKEDQTTLDDILAAQGFFAALHEGVEMSSALGDFWIKVVIDPILHDYPVLEIVSGIEVEYAERGRWVVEAEFPIRTWEEGNVVYRLRQRYSPGYIENLLYRGDKYNKGAEVPLTSHKSTEKLLPLFETKVPGMVAAVRIQNRRAATSDLQASEDIILAVNEALTIAQGNTRLVGRKRLLLRKRFLDRFGTFRTDDDILVMDDSGKQVAGAPDGDMGKQVEYSYEVQEIMGYIDSLFDLGLQGAGQAPQAVGRSQNDGPASGLAMLYKLMASIMETEASGRYLDEALAIIIGIMIQMDKAHFDGDWKDAETLPTITRVSGLPRDEEAQARVLVALTAAGAISRFESVRYQHPTWSDEQVAEEVARINADLAGTVAVDADFEADE